MYKHVMINIEVRLLKKLSMYQIIELEIKEKIENGEYLPGHTIDSENTLRQKYNVTRMTVRQALGNLVNLGYLYKKKGKGTFVKEKNTHDNITIIPELWKIDDLGYEKNVTKATINNVQCEKNKTTFHHNIEFTVNDDHGSIAIGQITINTKSELQIDTYEIIKDFHRIISEIFIEDKPVKKHSFAIISMSHSLCEVFNDQHNYCIQLTETYIDNNNHFLSRRSLIMNPKKFTINIEKKTPMP